MLVRRLAQTSLLKTLLLPGSADETLKPSGPSQQRQVAADRTDDLHSEGSAVGTLAQRDCHARIAEQSPGAVELRVPRRAERGRLAETTRRNQEITTLESEFKLFSRTGGLDV